MRKTMIYLEEGQYLRLKKTAAFSKKKMAELIREAVSEYLSRNKKGRRRCSFIGIASGPKGGRTSERVDEILEEVFKSS